ncbi:MAG: gluconate 2-dehydrogenase subunit 3 family protein [Ginsengibacter sp.]
MDRREAVKYISLLLGGTIVGGSAILSGCKSKTGVTLDFTSDQIAWLNEVADTILPPTDSPGAKAAKVGEFMKVMVNDSYEAKDQKIFIEGFQKLEDFSDKTFGQPFMKLSPEQRHELLVSLDKEQKEYMATKKKEDPGHYFRMMKELTLLGYFTSEIGSTKALRYVERPGSYDGCVPYKKGDKAFA